MARHRKLIYVLADGAHARFVERSAETHDFKTLRSMDGTQRLDAVRQEQRDEGAGRSFESDNKARHAVGAEDPYRKVKTEFVSAVAETLNEMLANGGWEAVVLAAPDRLLKVLREGVSPRVEIAGEVAKDLTKTPDHDLGEWLNALAFAGSP
jgi:protein required for attachment to host cells